MTAEASLQELQLVFSVIQSMKESYPQFYDKLLILLYKTERYKIPFGYVCQQIRGVEIKERYLNGIRHQSKLAEIHQDLFVLKTEYYEGYQHFSNLLHKHNWTGYNNICRMILGETPEDLKKGKCG